MARVQVTALGETTSLADRKRRAGRRLLVSPGGTGSSIDLRALLRSFVPAGFLLGPGDLVEPAQVRDLLADLAARVRARTPPLACLGTVDGSPAALPLPATAWPPPAVLGRVDEPDLTEAVARAFGAEAASLGFHAVLAPWLGLPRGGPEDQASYGPDPQVAARHVRAAVIGLDGAGILSFAGPFPGAAPPGATAVERGRTEVEAEDLAPLDAARDAGAAGAVLSAAAWPAWDPDRPAWRSPAVVQGLLREHARFAGLAVAPDLGPLLAGAIDPGPLAVDLAAAGVDLVPCTADPGIEVALWEALIRAQEDDPAIDRALEAADRRLDAVRARAFRPRPAAPADVLGAAAHRDLALRVRARGGG
jgi:beta-N-acetylhexosaminidase